MITGKMPEMRRMGMLITRYPLLVDAGFAGLLAIPVLFPKSYELWRNGQLPTVVDAIALATLLVGITVRRVWPVQTLLAGNVIAAATVLATGIEHALFGVFNLVIVYTAASRARRWAVWPAAGMSVLLCSASHVLRFKTEWLSPGNLALLTCVVVATAFGDAAGSRRAYVKIVEERARRAEQTREEEARRRVVEERLRIARELHDVVTQHIAVINVQAGAASHILKHRPEEAGVALNHIRDASDTVLKELASVVGVLRQSDDLATTEPTRGLARLNDLVKGFADAGIDVEYQMSGEPAVLPAVVDLAAYRIAQEALTNAHKHGTGTASLSLTYRPGSVILDITNPVPARGVADGNGYGIIGMRERAAAAGGLVTARTEPEGLFTVHAVLPTPDQKVTR